MLLTEAEIQKYRDVIGATKSFLESLQAYSTPGRLKNFRYATHEVESHRDGLLALDAVKSLNDLASELGVLTSYLSTAEAVLPDEHEWVERMRSVRSDILGQISDPKKRTDTSFRQQTTRRLVDLKTDYITTYLKLHRRSRLNIDEDKRKSELMNDTRLDKLKRLITIDLLSYSQLSDYQSRVAKLMPCYQLTEQDLQNASICTHCNFRPSAEQALAPAVNELVNLEEELDKLLRDWTQVMLTNLEDPTIKGNISLLKPASRELVENFLKERELPDKLEGDFIDSLQEVFSGLDKVEISSKQLRQALLAGGSPATVDELKARFDKFLGDLSKGKSLDKIRILLG